RNLRREGSRRPRRRRPPAGCDFPPAARYFTKHLCHCLRLLEGGRWTARAGAHGGAFVKPGNAPTQQTLSSSVSLAVPASGEPDTREGGGPSSWWQYLLTRVIELGIRFFWGKEAFPATMAADVSLLAGAWRMAWIRALGAVGVRRYGARSGRG